MENIIFNKTEWLGMVYEAMRLKYSNALPAECIAWLTDELSVQVELIDVPQERLNIFALADRICQCTEWAEVELILGEDAELTVSNNGHEYHTFPEWEGMILHIDWEDVLK